MDVALFPPYCLTWDQTMLEVVKIMMTSFKRSCASSVVFNGPDPATGHCQPTPLPETPGHSQTGLVQSLVGSLLLSPGSWCIQGFVCALQESISKSCVSSDGSMVGLMATSSKRAYAIPGSTARRSNKSILKDISPEYSLERLMLKLKFQYFGHLMWKTDSLEKTLIDARQDWMQEKKGMTEDEMVGWHHWLDGPESE